MTKFSKTLLVCLAGAIVSPAVRADSTVQTATLKDLQTVGSTTKKQKHQQYDLVLDGAVNEYVCRTKLGSSLKATDFVVGSPVEFKVSGQNGQATTSAGKHTKCAIVRVGTVPPLQHQP
jgi:hypothetical protein